MDISQLGERALIERLSLKFPQDLPGQTIGIGDDCAVIPWNDSESLLISTDMLIENSHFFKTSIASQDLGHKSLAVNLSDIAAMGGRPASAFLSVGLPGDLKLQWFDGFLEGFRKLAEIYNIHLLGGDTTQSKAGIVVQVTIVGFAKNQNIKLRSSAEIGDWICVTGSLGDSYAGLRCILENKPESSFTQPLICRHHRPQPHVLEGQWLSQFFDVHAMMDISDGLDLTLKEILRRSKCGAEVNLNKLPLSRELIEASDFYDWGAPVMAAAGGEDYVLALTVSESRIEEIKKGFEEKFSRPLHVVGKIVDSSEGLSYQLENQPFLGPIKAWNHFD